MDDQRAILECLEGRRNAFRHLVERYQREAVGHALALVAHREDALDAVQDAFLDAFRALGRFDRGREFYPWFYTILRNRCLKLLGRRRPAANLDRASLLARPAASEGGESEALETALGDLGPAERELVLLKHLDGLSYQELGRRLGVPAGTVMSRLYHARRRLSERLEARGAPAGQGTGGER